MNTRLDPTTPLVSVIIATFNNEHTIKTALESIVRQTYTNTEIIVVNDFSTDNTYAVAKAYAESDSRIRVVSADFDDPNRFDAHIRRNINAGWSARNTGLLHAQGKLITFQDADDASLLNRIEVQVKLLHRYSALHILTGWQPYDENKLNTELPLEDIGSIQPTYNPEDLYRLSQETKGIGFKLAPSISHAIPFHIRRMRILHHLFFGSLDPFPGAGNNPLFTREVADSIQFKKLSDRVWPSFMGRGADRDFHFHVAELFRNSYVFDAPLYLWRTGTQTEIPT